MSCWAKVAVMATALESLYAAVKVLILWSSTNGQAQHEMKRIVGYRMLAYFLKRLKAWPNNQILELILVGFKQHNNKVAENS